MVVFFWLSNKTNITVLHLLHSPIRLWDNSMFLSQSLHYGDNDHLQLDLLILSSHSSFSSYRLLRNQVPSSIFFWTQFCGCLKTRWRGIRGWLREYVRSRGWYTVSGLFLFNFGIVRISATEFILKRFFQIGLKLSWDEEFIPWAMKRNSFRIFTKEDE